MAVWETGIAIAVAFAMVVLKEDIIKGKLGWVVLLIPVSMFMAGFRYDSSELIGLSLLTLLAFVFADLGWKTAKPIVDKKIKNKKFVIKFTK